MRRPMAVAIATLFAVTAPARADFFTADKFAAYGDFRFRAEADWDSQDAAGVPRDDRVRLRVRLRAGFRFDPTEHWRLEARLRSGQEGSQQSPHVTVVDFGDNDTGDMSFTFDRWYLRGKAGGFEAWAGRNDLPFWKQDEFLLDDDVTMPGVALTWKADLGPGDLSVAGGYFTPPVGMRAASGHLAAAQVAYQPELGGVRWTFAVGGYGFEATPDDPDNSGLLQGNGARDYTILAAGVQARWPVCGRTLTLGADGIRNLENYDSADPDPVTAANFDQTDGYVLLATYGSLDKKDDWLVGYYYAHVEALAVNNSYAQDDWVRWGSALQTRASDLEGHEFRFGWAFNEKMNVLARLYFAESITSDEDGKRFRADVNYRF